MKPFPVALVAIVSVVAGCGAPDSGSEAEEREPPQRLDKPYADRVKELEAQNLQRVQDQLEEADRQSGSKDDEERDGRR